MENQKVTAMDTEVIAEVKPKLGLGERMAVVEILEKLQPTGYMYVGGSYLLYLNKLLKSQPEDIDIILINPTKATLIYLEAIQPFATSSSADYEGQQNRQMKFASTVWDTDLNLLIYDIPNYKPVNTGIKVELGGVLLPAGTIDNIFKAWKRYSKIVNGTRCYRSKDINKANEVRATLPPINAQWIIK